MITLSTSEVLSKLAGVKKTGERQYKAKCPAHKDAVASLSVLDDNGKPVMFCHAGCAIEDIANAIGASSLSSTNPSKNCGIEKCVQYYVYTDSENQPLFRKGRTLEKEFFMQHVDSLGNWVKGKGTADTVLYNLPSVSNARNNNEVIFVVEGEKDVDTLVGHGYTATTNFEGAATWRNEYSAVLAGATVIIVPDNDDPGIKHAEVVASSVSKYTQTVKIINLQEIWSSIFPKADITDYIDAHLDKKAAWEAFENLVVATPFYSNTLTRSGLKIVSAVKLIEESQNKEFVFEGILPMGLAVLAGPPKIGKSWMALQMAICAVKGEPFLGKQSCKMGAMYISLEDTEKRISERMHRICDCQRDLSNLDICLNIDVDQDVATVIDKYIDHNPECKLIIIDPFVLSRGQRNKGDTYYDYDYRDISKLKTVADKRSICVLLIHHTIKSSDFKGLIDKPSGSRGVTAAADTIIILDKRFENKPDISLSAIGRDLHITEINILMDDSCKWQRVIDYEHKQNYSYQNDPLVITLRKILQNRPDGWSATASEILAQCITIAGHSPVSANNPASMSKYVLKLSDQLSQIDSISYTPPPKNGSNGKRVHHFYRVLSEEVK